jgi:DNA-binding GntR family transcriptional regulator
VKPRTALTLPELQATEPDVTPGSLSELAYLLIRDRIVSLQLQPGMLIEEQVLMADLNLGRTPIREALTRLTDERLVTSIPRRGRVVAEINITDLWSISEVRVEIEGVAARLAAQRATAAERSTAEELRAALAELASDFSQRKLMRLDQRIHRHVHRCSHNEFLDSTLERFFNLSLRLWFYRLDMLAEVFDHADVHPGVEELDGVLKAVVEGDADRAETTMRHHVTRFQHEIQQLLGGPAAVTAQRSVTRSA